MFAVCRLCLLFGILSLLSIECHSFTVVPLSGGAVLVDVAASSTFLNHPSTTTLLLSSSDDEASFLEDDDFDDEDDEEVEPGKMRVSEITAELKLRGVDYGDCFDKESLVVRLTEARETGKANPEILDKLNKSKLEETFNERKVDIKDDDIDRVLASDGKLPGGMSPETLKAMMGNPELMALMQSPKMQDAMRLMMTGGQEELERGIAEDPEMREIVAKLDSIMRGTLQ